MYKGKIMSDKQRISKNEKNISDNKSDISRILGIVNNGLVMRITRIENRIWALIVGLILILLTVIGELIFLIIRLGMEKVP